MGAAAGRPGGLAAWHAGEAWQYMGSQWDGQRAVHQFRHRAHPGYHGQRVYQEVIEDDRGAQLGALSDGRV